MSVWPRVRLGDIFTIARGGSPRPIDAFITDDPSGINWIMIGDAAEGSKYISSTKKRIRREGVSRSREVKSGDFLLTNSMSFGHPYILGTQGCIHDGWLVLSPQSANVNPDYFYHLLGSPVVYAEFERLAAGAVVKNLNSELVRGVKVPMPPLEEQQRIADILDKADAIRRKRKEVIALTEELLLSAFLEVFGDPVINPKGWPMETLDGLVDKERGISYGVVQRGPEVDGGVPIVRISNFVNNRFDGSTVVRTSQEISNAYRRTVLEGGELVVSIRGTVGRVAVVPPSACGWNVSREVAVVPLKEGVSRPLVHAALLSDGVQRFILGNVKGVAQSGINLSDLRLAPIPLPSGRDVGRFSDCARTIAQLENRSTAAGVESDTLFNSLVARAFSGSLEAPR